MAYYPGVPQSTPYPANGNVTGSSDWNTGYNAGLSAFAEYLATSAAAYNQSQGSAGNSAPAPKNDVLGQFGWSGYSAPQQPAAPAPAAITGQQQGASGQFGGNQGFGAFIPQYQGPSSSQQHQGPSASQQQGQPAPQLQHGTPAPSVPSWNQGFGAYFASQQPEAPVQNATTTPQAGTMFNFGGNTAQAGTASHTPAAQNTLGQFGFSGNSAPFSYSTPLSYGAAPNFSGYNFGGFSTSVKREVPIPNFSGYNFGGFSTSVKRETTYTQPMAYSFGGLATSVKREVTGATYVNGATPSFSVTTFLPPAAVTTEYIAPPPPQVINRVETIIREVPVPAPYPVAQPYAVPTPVPVPTPVAVPAPAPVQIGFRPVQVGWARALPLGAVGHSRRHRRGRHFSH